MLTSILCPEKSSVYGQSFGQGVTKCKGRNPRHHFNCSYEYELWQAGHRACASRSLRLCRWLFILSVINIVLIVANVKRKAYFYFNATIQLFPDFLLTMLLGIPIVFFIVNIAVLITLREEKRKNAPPEAFSASKV
jgi:uncharacterized integral membrane protein